jgi:hypothetical protein
MQRSVVANFDVLKGERRQMTPCVRETGSERRA